MISILTIHMKGIKVNREDNCLAKVRYKKYTRPSKISPKPEHGSTLPNSQLELFYFYILRDGSDPDEEDIN